MLPTRYSVLFAVYRQSHVTRIALSHLYPLLAHHSDLFITLPARYLAMAQFNSARQLVQKASDRQDCLSTHSLHNSSPYSSACFLVLNIRSLESIRLISTV